MAGRHILSAAVMLALFVMGCAGRSVRCEQPAEMGTTRVRESACEVMRRIGFHEIMEQARRAGLVTRRAGLSDGTDRRPLLAQSGETIGVSRIAYVLTEKAVEGGVAGEVAAAVEALCQSAIFETLLPLVILLRPATIAPEPPLPGESHRGSARCKDNESPPLASFPARSAESDRSPEPPPPAMPLPAPHADEPSRCLPCTPVPAGGTAFEFHSIANGDRDHDGMPEHTHHFRMNQSPPSRGCICFWHRNFLKPTPGFSPLPGAVPVQAAGGGGLAR